jgi:hypothetical protein
MQAILKESQIIISSQPWPVLKPSADPSGTALFIGPSDF